MISAPSASEILLDYGNYRYFENDEHKDIAEPWTRHQLGDSTITRVKRIATAFGQYFEVQCWQRGGEYERVLIQWKNGKHKASADYWFLGGCWRLSRLVDGVHSTDEVQREVLFFPLMRVFTGSIIRELLAKEGGGQRTCALDKRPSGHE